MKFQIYEEEFFKGQWRWRLRAANGRIIADSGEAYSSRSGCRRAVNGLREQMQREFIPVEVLDD